MDRDPRQDFQCPVTFNVHFLPLCYHLDPKSSFSSTPDNHTINRVLTHSDQFEKPLEWKTAPEFLGEGMKLAAMRVSSVDFRYLESLDFTGVKAGESSVPQIRHCP